jgi:hypothetical protein
MRNLPPEILLLILESLNLGDLAVLQTILPVYKRRLVETVAVEQIASFLADGKATANFYVGSKQYCPRQDVDDGTETYITKRTKRRCDATFQVCDQQEPNKGGFRLVGRGGLIWNEHACRHGNRPAKLIRFVVDYTLKEETLRFFCTSPGAQSPKWSGIRWPNHLTQSFGDFKLYHRRINEMGKTSEKMKLPTEWCRWLNDEVVIAMEFGSRTHIRARCKGIGRGPQGTYCRSFILSDYSVKWELLNDLPSSISKLCQCK